MAHTMTAGAGEMYMITSSGKEIELGTISGLTFTPLTPEPDLTFSDEERKMLKIWLEEDDETVNRTID